MAPIKTAIIGVGNCASSLVQGVAYYRESNSPQGLTTRTTIRRM